VLSPTTSSSATFLLAYSLGAGGRLGWPVRALAVLGAGTQLPALVFGLRYWRPERTDVMRCVLNPSQCIRPR
jgi:hypothetical protein